MGVFRKFINFSTNIVSKKWNKDSVLKVRVEASR